MLYYGLRSRSVSHSGRLAHSRIRVLVQRYTTVSYRIQWQRRQQQRQWWNQWKVDRHEQTTVWIFKITVLCSHNNFWYRTIIYLYTLIIIVNDLAVIASNRPWEYRYPPSWDRNYTHNISFDIWQGYPTFRLWRAAFISSLTWRASMQYRPLSRRYLNVNNIIVIVM